MVPLIVLSYWNLSSLTPACIDLYACKGALIRVQLLSQKLTIRLNFVCQNFSSKCMYTTVCYVCVMCDGCCV